jgi:hypothetical protein
VLWHARRHGAQRRERRGAHGSRAQGRPARLPALRRGAAPLGMGAASCPPPRRRRRRPFAAAFSLLVLPAHLGAARRSGACPPGRRGGPDRRSDAATRPKARAAAVSKASGSKSASACWRCAWRAARSASARATSGPTDNSASVTAVISGSGGSAVASTMRAKRITVEVSRMPRAGLGLLTGASRGQRRGPLAAHRDRREEAGATSSAAPPPRAGSAEEGGALRPAFHLGSP